MCILRKIISLCVVLLGLFVLQTACSASERAQYKITHFHYTAAAGSLYIEVGLNNAGQDFALAVDPSNPQRLVLDLKRTKIGSIRKNIALDGEIAQKIEFSQLDKANGQAVITLPDNAGKYSYKLRFVPAENLIVHTAWSLKSKKRSFGDFSVTGVRGRTIAIDPGHGGSDTGAIGPDGIREKDVTFAIAQRVDDILLRSGARVVMTRTEDVDVFGPNASDREELQARVDAGDAVPEWTSLSASTPMPLRVRRPMERRRFIMRKQATMPCWPSCCKMEWLSMGSALIAGPPRPTSTF